MGKTQFVRDLRPGLSLSEYFVAEGKNLGYTGNGKPFLRLQLADRSGSVPAICWENVQAFAEAFQNGEVVKVHGLTSVYRDQLQVTITRLRRAREDEIDAADFIPASRYPVETMLEDLRGVIATIHNPWLAQLLRRVFDPEGELLPRFARQTAARGIHHAYVGGLLEHTLEMVRIAETLVELHPEYTNREMVIAAILLHDIGKLDEYSLNGMSFEQTVAGRLAGHLYLGARRVEAMIQEIPGFPEALAQELIHCILSHHGELEFGAVTTPKTLNAYIVHLADWVSARLNQFRSLYDRHPAGAGDWTAVDRHLGLRAYRGFFDRGCAEPDQPPQAEGDGE